MRLGAQGREEHLGFAGYAESLGVTVAYHLHVGHAVNTKDEWRRFMTWLDRCKLCFDMSYAVFWDFDPVEALREFADVTVYVHLHDYNSVPISVEIGEGMMCNSPAFIRALEEIGYEGWITACPGRIERNENEKFAMNRTYLKEIGY